MTFSMSKQTESYFSREGNAGWFATFVKSVDDAPHDAGIERALDLLDSLVQRRFVVTRQHGDALLSENRPGVEFFGGDVHGAARFACSGLDGLAHGVPALELGQKTRVRVKDSPGIRGVELAGHDRPETRHRHQVNVPRRQLIGEWLRRHSPTRPLAVGRESARRR